jgi:peptide/nickel transport system permease protein
VSALRHAGADALGKVARLILGLYAVLAVFGPVVAPHPPFDTLYVQGGGVARLQPPSGTFWLGTNNLGQDVFSQLLHGFRLAFVVGLTAALVSSLIGTNVGLIAGYFGGRVDQLLMRVTDVAYGIPFLPFALIVISMARPSLTAIIAVIALTLWRTQARVIRAQVLTVKERAFVRAAQAAGAGHIRIVYGHIAPNVLPIALLYVALGVSSAVLMEASLSFLGFGDPNAATWGQMMNVAFFAGAIRNAWWWVLPPGITLSVFVVTVYFLTRSYEHIANPRLGGAR